jgi:hypothetical protein
MLQLTKRPLKRRRALMPGAEDLLSTKLIKEELGELNIIISENIRLLEDYGEDASLKMNLDSLRHRQLQLIRELNDVRAKRHQLTFDVTFNGESVHGSVMSISVMGEVLSTFQDILTSLIHKMLLGREAGNKVSSDIKRRSEMVLVTTAPGSFRLVIGGPDMAFIDEKTYENALIQLNELMMTGMDKESMKLKRQQVGARAFHKYKSLAKVLKSSKTSMTLYDHVSPKGFKPLQIDSSHAEKIVEIINEVEEMPDEIIEDSGFLTGVLFDTRVFHFVFNDGRRIEGKLADELTGTIVKPCIDENVDKKVRSVAKLLLKTEYNDIEDRESKKWTLVDIKSI